MFDVPSYEQRVMVHVTYVIGIIKILAVIIDHPNPSNMYYDGRIT